MKKTIYLVLGLVFACSSPAPKGVTILDPSLETIVSSTAQIEYLTEKKYTISEGPVWSLKHNGLLFTDVAANQMYLWQNDTGVRLFMEPSGHTGIAPTFDTHQGANGVAFYGNQMVLCQHGDRRVAYLEKMDGKVPTFRTLVAAFEGKRFNSPNDLIINRMGDIFFTDPPYGLFNPTTGTYDETIHKELPFNGVFVYKASGELELITKTLSRPNGIGLSLDERYLYVNNSDPANPVMMRYDRDQQWAGELFFDGTELGKKYDGNFDGMKVHSSGTIFSTGPNGIIILSPQGTLLGQINFGGKITNCAFDPNEEYLYVTTFDRLARVKLQP